MHSKWFKGPKVTNQPFLMHCYVNRKSHQLNTESKLDFQWKKNQLETWEQKSWTVTACKFVDHKKWKICKSNNALHAAAWNPFKLHSVLLVVRSLLCIDVRNITYTNCYQFRKIVNVNWQIMTKCWIYFKSEACLAHVKIR